MCLFLMREPSRLNLGARLRGRGAEQGRGPSRSPQRPPARTAPSPGPTCVFLRPAGPDSDSGVWVSGVGGSEPEGPCPVPARRRPRASPRKTPRHLPRLPQLSRELSAPSLTPPLTERKFRGATARRRDTPAPRQRAVSAQARRPRSSPLFAQSLDVSGRWVLCRAGPSGG